MLERKTFRKIADLLQDAVVITDALGRITWTNQAFHDLCGHSKSSVINRKPGSFLQGPDTDQRMIDRIRNAIKKREPIESELLNYHFNGRPYWVSLRITPIFKESGELDGFVAIERETTEARWREHTLEEEVGQLYSTLVQVVELEKKPGD